MDEHSITKGPLNSKSIDLAYSIIFIIILKYLKNAINFNTIDFLFKRLAYKLNRRYAICALYFRCWLTLIAINRCFVFFSGVFDIENRFSVFYPNFRASIILSNFINSISRSWTLISINWIASQIWLNLETLPALNGYIRSFCFSMGEINKIRHKVNGKTK